MGERYTWSNNQVTPIFSILDRVFVNNAWEDKYPLVTAQVCTRIGSDHNPIIVDTGGRPSKMPTYFKFDPTWLTQEGFRNWVTDRWPVRLKAGSRDHWHVISGILHRAMKGWGANFGSNLRKHKQQLLLEIDAIDREANFTDLPPTTWEHRYKLERELIEIYTAEEIYWQKRGGQKWILQGDSNTAFFHKCANGRKRKTLIKSLEEEGRGISGPVELRQHIDAYYKMLFGREQTEDIHLIEDLWQAHQKVSDEENEELIKPFTWEELDFSMKETKNNTTPGPNCFSVEFFKEFWPLIRPLVKEMLDDLHRGSFDLRRLNYGVIILLPKLKLPNNIKQFRPICLLNVIYKIITKILTIRLSKIAERIISKNQTAFILGRNILDGVVILQEVLHELRVKN